MRYCVFVACALFVAGCGSDDTTSAPPQDAGSDATVDASSADAAGDVTTGDANVDAALDASADASTDASASDAAIDVAPDARADADAATCVPTGAEDCYNGVDDDCNNATDCADSACTPTSECVQNAPGFQLGAEVGSSAACPTSYTASSTGLDQGLVAPSTCSGCTCSSVMECSTKIYRMSGACPGGTLGTGYTVKNTTCTGGGTVNITGGSIHVDPVVPLTACTPIGAPSLGAATWTTQAKFCGTTKIGGGCATGSVCVPKTGGPKHCALVAGAQQCPGTYTAEMGGTWYTGFTDTRSCGSMCMCGSPTGASCGTSFVRAYAGSPFCAGLNSDLVPNHDNCGLDTTLASALVVEQNVTQPTCTSNNTVTGTATPTGAQTLCCL